MKLVTGGVTDDQWRCAVCDRTALEKNGATFKEYKIKIFLFVWSHSRPARVIHNESFKDSDCSIAV